MIEPTRTSAEAEAVGEWGDGAVAVRAVFQRGARCNAGGRDSSI